MSPKVYDDNNITDLINIIIMEQKYEQDESCTRTCIQRKQSTHSYLILTVHSTFARLMSHHNSRQLETS